MKESMEQKFNKEVEAVWAEVGEALVATGRTCEEATQLVRLYTLCMEWPAEALRDVMHRATEKKKAAWRERGEIGGHDIWSFDEWLAGSGPRTRQETIDLFHAIANECAHGDYLTKRHGTMLFVQRYGSRNYGRLVSPREICFVLTNLRRRLNDED